MQRKGNMGAIFRGMVTAHMEAVDAKMVDDVRNFLFGPPGAGGFDLAALNIQRGRDHGLPGYNAVRKAYGLRRVYSFYQITRDRKLRSALRELYGHADNIDVFVGGLAETHKRGSMLGPLFHRIVADQFARLRDGDRFWHEKRLHKHFSKRFVKKIKRTRLADIIKRNTDVKDIQWNIFKVYERHAGSHRHDKMHGKQHSDLMMGYRGDDDMYGYDGDDQMHGGKGWDILYGGKGDDKLEGGRGYDELYGGPGKDTYVFKRGSGVDVIWDWEKHDKIDLTGYYIDHHKVKIHRKGHGKTVIVIDKRNKIIIHHGKRDKIKKDDMMF